MFLELKNVKKKFYGGCHAINALDGGNLKMVKGEFVSVMGHSGSGKTTLLNIVGCLLCPDEGQYFLDDENVGTLNDQKLSRIRGKIGFIFQSFNLINRFSVQKNVELPLIYSEIDKIERAKLALDSLEEVGLKDRALDYPNELSGGEQQRVAIARSIASQPKIILADEPTGNLDVDSEREVMRLLSALNKKGITILLVTHEEVIAKYASRSI